MSDAINKAVDICSCLSVRTNITNSMYCVPSKLRFVSKQVASGVPKIKYSLTAPKAPYNIYVM